MRLILCFLLMTASWVHAQMPNYETEFLSAHQLYQRAADGEKSATRDAESALARLAEQYPNDPVAQLLHGSSQTLRGRDAWMPWNKLNYTEDGLEQMSDALRLLGDEHWDYRFDSLPVPVYVRMVAGINFVEVPDMFGRFEQGFELLQQLSEDPAITSLPTDVQSLIHYYAARAADKASEESVRQQALQHLFALGADDRYSQLARDRWGQE